MLFFLIYNLIYYMHTHRYADDITRFYVHFQIWCLHIMYYSTRVNYSFRAKLTPPTSKLTVCSRMAIQGDFPSILLIFSLKINLFKFLEFSRILNDHIIFIFRKLLKERLRINLFFFNEDHPFSFKLLK